MSGRTPSSSLSTEAVRLFVRSQFVRPPVFINKPSCDISTHNKMMSVLSERGPSAPREKSPYLRIDSLLLSACTTPCLFIWPHAIVLQGFCDILAPAARQWNEPSLIICRTTWFACDHRSPRGACLPLCLLIDPLSRACLRLQFSTQHCNLLFLAIIKSAVCITAMR